MERGGRERAEDDSFDRSLRKRAARPKRRLAAAARTVESRGRRPAAAAAERRTRARAADARSSHCTSSTATTTGLSAARAPSRPSEAHRRRAWVRLPVASAPSSAMSSACRCGGGRSSRRLVVRRARQVGESCIREGRLRLGGPSDEHAKLAPRRTVERLTPDRRLADPGLAIHDQRAAGLRNPVEKALDRVEVRISPDHGLLHRPLCSPSGCRRAPIVLNGRAKGNTPRRLP